MSIFDRERKRLGITPLNRGSIFAEERAALSQQGQYSGSPTAPQSINPSPIEPVQQEPKSNWFADSQKAIYNKTLKPVQDFTNRTATSFLNSTGLGQPTKILQNNQPDNVPSFVSDMYRPAETTSEKVADVTGFLGGTVAPYSLAYKTAGKGLQLGYNFLTKGIAPASKLGKASLNAGRLSAGGLGAGLGYGAASQGVDELLNPNDATFGERAKIVAIEGALGAVGDPALRALGVGLKKAYKSYSPSIKNKVDELIGKFSKGKINEKQLKDEILMLPEGKTIRNAVETPQPLQEKFISAKKKPNVYADRLEEFKNVAMSQHLPPGREKEAMEEIWRNMSRYDESITLDELIKRGTPSLEQIKPKTNLSLKNPLEPNVYGVSKANQMNVSTRQKENPVNFTIPETKPLEYVGRLEPMNKLKVQTGKPLDSNLNKMDLENQVTVGQDNLSTNMGKKVTETIPEGGNADTFRVKISRDLKTEKKSFSQRIEEFRSKAIDDLAALEEAEIKIKGSVSSAEDSFYKSGRLFKGVPEKSFQIVKQRLAPVVNDIEKLGYKSDDLGDYALAVHARDVNAKGIESGMTTQEIDDVIAKFGTKEMEAARKELLAINNDMLEVLVDGQVITRDLVDTLKVKHPNYMAMFRDMDDNAVGFTEGLFQALANVNSPIKRLKGSKKKIIDPLESMVKNIFQSVQAAERNKVALQLSKLSKIDVDNKYIRQLDKDEAVGRKNVVSVLENGEKVKYEVEPQVYKALLNLDQQSSNLFIEILSKPASVLRAGATLTPEFGLRNPMKDIVQAYTTSNSGFNPLVDFPVAMFNIIAGKTGKGGQLYKQWLDDMGGYGNIVSMDRKMHREALTKVLKETNSKKFVNVISQKSVIGLLRTISDTTESATKLGEYRAALRSGTTRQEAAYRSRDVMDFARAGSSVRQINKVIAFFNASIQGKSKIIRSIKQDPVGFTTRAFTAVTVPTIGVFMMQKFMANDVQKQTIQDSPSWMRNTFWLIPIPGTDMVARMPKPFDLSILFSNVIERGLEYAFNNDKEAFDGFARESMGDLAVPTQITGMLPVIEGMANYSFFREGNIIPQREDNLNFSDQYDANTSGTAKVLAKGAEKLTGGQGAFKNFSSPRIMDNTVKGLTAGLGTYYTSFADAIADGLNLTDKPPKPKKGFTQLPVAKAFLVNEHQSSKSLDSVYKEKDRLTKEKGSAKLNREPFRDEGKLKYINTQTSIISDIGKKIRDIKDSRLLNPLEKKKKIDELIKRRNEIARKTEERIK